MLKFLTHNAQQRFKALQDKLSNFSISAEEQKELVELVASAQKMALERDSVVARLKTDIAAYGVAVTELFSAAELRQAAGTGRAVAGPLKDLGKRKTKPASEARAATVLIRAKVGKGAGAPSKYYRGQKLPPVVPKNFKALDDGQALSTNLAHHFTDEGRAYFATAEGQLELQRLEQYIRTGKVPAKTAA